MFGIIGKAKDKDAGFIDDPVGWAILAAFTVACFALVFFGLRYFDAENYNRVSDQFEKTVEMTEDGVKEISKELNIAASDDVEQVITEFIISRSDKGVEAEDLISEIGKIDTSFDPSGVNVRSLDRVISSHRSNIDREINELSDLLIFRKKYYDSDSFEVSYKSKKHTGTDAYKIVEDLIEGRLP